MFIFYETDIKEVEEEVVVKEMVKSDPEVSSGILNQEIFNWYGSAALPIYLNYHKRYGTKCHNPIWIFKKNFLSLQKREDKVMKRNSNIWWWHKLIRKQGD